MENMMKNAPVVVLVRPQMGENIGATARAMMNFGLSDLRVVAPRDGWPNAKAYEMSAHATSIIEKAGIYPSLSEALSDCEYVYAASARERDMQLDCKTPRMMVEHIASHAYKNAIVFGPENNGLSNDDVAHCHCLVTIPADPANTSLNLAQSVVVLAYEWFQLGERFSEHVVSGGIEYANVGEVQALYDVLITSLEERQHFTLQHKTHVMQRNIRSMLGRLPLTSQDVQSLHGIIRTLSK